MKLITIREFAAQYEYPEHLVRSVVKENLIPFIRVGNRKYLNGEMADEAIKRLMEGKTSVCGYNASLKKED